MTTPEPRAEPGDEEWCAEMAIAYNYGLIEPRRERRRPRRSAR